MEDASARLDSVEQPMDSVWQYVEIATKFGMAMAVCVWKDTLRTAEVNASGRV